jgi:hypothetical protein
LLSVVLKPDLLVFDFFVDGRQDDRANIVENTVMKFVNFIPMRDTKRYYLVMDNWFTTPRVMQRTRERNEGVVGTARGRPGKAEPFPALEMHESNQRYLIQLSVFDASSQELLGGKMVRQRQRKWL